MQHLVVLEVMHQCERNNVQCTRHIHRRARYANRWGFLSEAIIASGVSRVHAYDAADGNAFAFPRGHHNEHQQTKRQRQPAAGDNLIEVCREQRYVDAQEAHRIIATRNLFQCQFRYATVVGKKMSAPWCLLPQYRSRRGRLLECSKLTITITTAK